MKSNFQLRRYFVLTCAVLALSVSAGCQTTQVSEWWNISGKAPTEIKSAPASAPSFDPTAGPRGQRPLEPLIAQDPKVADIDPNVKMRELNEAQNSLNRPQGNLQTVRVGLLLPLSGQPAEVGKQLLDAAQLALFDFADPSYELMPYDTTGTAEGAKRAAQDAINDGAQLLIGPLLSSLTKAISPIAASAGVQVLAFTNDASAANSNVVVLGLRPDEEVRRIIAFAAERGATRFALIAPNNAYGRQVAESFHQIVPAVGASLSKQRFFEPGTRDFSDMIKEMADYDLRHKELLAQIKELEAKTDEISKKTVEQLKTLQTVGDVDFDALLIAAGGTDLQSIAAHLPYYDVDPKKVRMLGTGLWNAAWVGSEPALFGGWYAAPPPAARAEFDALFQRTYGRAPHLLNTLAYDAVALSAVLSAGNKPSNFTRQVFADPAGFAGRDGIFRLHPSGLSERGLAVLQVGKKAPSVISKAPVSFQDVMN